MKKYITILLALCAAVVASAQDFDTTGIYGERAFGDHTPAWT